MPGLTDLAIGDLDSARSWLRAAYDRTCALMIQISDHAHKVSFDDRGHEFVSVGGVREWVVPMLETKPYRKVSGIAPYLEALATLVDCIAEIHHATDPVSPRLPSLVCERSSWQTSFETWEVAITARLPTDPSDAEAELLERRRRVALFADELATARAEAVERAEDVLGTPVDEWTATLYCFLVDRPWRKGPKIRVAPRIKEKWLKETTAAVELPDDEVAIGLADWGDLIFGQRSVYFHNTPGYFGTISPVVHSVTYAEPAGEQPRLNERGTAIRLGEDVHWDNPLSAKHCLTLFVQLSDLAATFAD